jgi:hypothetical protein
MQRDSEVILQHISLVPREPLQAGLDIGLLKLIQLLAGCDVLEFQPTELVRTEGRRPVRILRYPCHLSIQKSGGISRAISRMRRSTS